MNTQREDEEDIRLVRLVLTGNPEAFRGLVKKYEKTIYRFCLSYTKYPEEAEDAAQEVFLRAFSSLKTFSLELRFKTWLFSIAANHLRSRWRKARSFMEKLRRAFFAGEGRNMEDPEETARRNMEGEAIREAVLQLPGTLKPCVYLYYLEDLPVAEIAKALGLGEEAVKSRLFRARKVLREKLSGLV